MKAFLKKLNDTDIRHIASILIIVGVFGLVILQHFVKIPEGNAKTVERATDQLIVLGFAVVVGYLFMNQKRDKPLASQETEKSIPDPNQ
jgi:mannose/fructose/N-acetylgalactosamine-specific phosphotransferase system component IIC